MNELRKRLIRLAHENPGEVRDAVLPLLKEAKYGKGRIVKFKRALGELLVDVEGYGLVKVTLDSSGMTTTHGRHPSAVTWAALQAVKAYRKAGFPTIRPHEKWPKEGSTKEADVRPTFNIAKPTMADVKQAYKIGWRGGVDFDPALDASLEARAQREIETLAADLRGDVQRVVKGAGMTTMKLNDVAMDIAFLAFWAGVRDGAK